MGGPAAAAMAVAGAEVDEAVPGTLGVSIEEAGGGKGWEQRGAFSETENDHGACRPVEEVRQGRQDQGR